MIDVRDLCFHYQGSKHQVFSHFALQLQPGSVYGLLGKNGTGKSTLLYLISGLLRPDSGTVMVNGMESRLRLPEMLQEVFIVPEEYAMPDMSFEAFADMMRAFYPHFSDDLLAKCLADFEMPARPNLKELSMGQKKKVYMSFAIATGTRLLMMDELGPHEAEAVRFQAAVFRALDGDIPILGVLQQAESEFLHRIARHPQVTVLTVTEENRDALLPELLRWWKNK